MSWFLLSIATAALWAVDNVLDKFVLSKKLRDPYAYNVLTNLNDVIPALLIALLVPIRFDPVFSTIGFLLGVWSVWSLLYYNKAMMREEASRVSSLEWVSPVFVAILAYIFAGERLFFYNYLGILLIIVGAIVISHEKRRGSKIILSPALWLIVTFAFLVAVEDVASKWALGHIDYWSFFFWTCIGSVVTALVMLSFANVRRAFVEEMKRIRIRTLLLILSASLVYYVANVSFYAALTVGLVTLVSAIVATQPIFTFLYALVLRRGRPTILKEDFRRFNMLTKILGIAVIVAGVWLATAP